MIARNKGHVVTVASTASYVGVAGMADYTASKAAVLSFHEGEFWHVLAVEYGSVHDAMITNITIS